MSQESELQMPKGDAHIVVEDAEVDFSNYRFEDWLSAAIFWVLGLVVFYQFFTRYVLNDSASWTEEIARYLLIGVVFVGAAVGVRKNNHVQVDLVYHYIPKSLARSMATFVDIVRIAFFATSSVLTYMLIQTIGNTSMAVVDLPMGIVYGFVLLGFVLMTWRAIGLAIKHWRAGESILENPEMTV